jgi:RNA polymerase sigma-70 factor (ECF subfamily)
MAVDAPGQTALDFDELRAVLERALARACPSSLAGEREDLAQRAMVRLLELQARRGEEAVTAASYVWRTAYSVVIDELRRRRRDRAVPLDDDAPDEVPASRTPEDDRATREAGRALRGCLATLAEPRRIAVMLHLQGHVRSQGAALVGWPVKRFENLVYRGLAELRLCLESKGVKP